ncbi:MAG: ATP-binding protein [Dehalococcoidia bacterium]
MPETPIIDEELCKGCGLCVSVCRLDGLVIVGKVVVVVQTVQCDWCADCELVCPTGAISCPFEIVFQRS